MRIFSFTLLCMYSLLAHAAPVYYEFKGTVTRFGVGGSSESLPAMLESGFDIGDPVSYLLIVDQDEPGFRMVDGVKQVIPGFENPSARVDRFFADYISGDKIPFGGGFGYYHDPYTSFMGESVLAKSPVTTEQARFDVSTGLSITSAFGLNKHINELVIGDPFQLTDSWTGQSSGDLHLMFGDLTLSRIGVSVVPLPGAAWLFGFGLMTIIGISRKKAAQS